MRPGLGVALEVASASSASSADDKDDKAAKASVSSIDTVLDDASSNASTKNWSTSKMSTEVTKQILLKGDDFLASMDVLKLMLGRRGQGRFMARTYCRTGQDKTDQDGTSADDAERSPLTNGI